MFNAKKEEIQSADIQTNSFIGKGTTVQGDVQSEGSLRLEGQIEGKVNIRSKLILATGSSIKGNVSATNAEISSTVEGNIEVTELLILKGEAIIKGDIQTQRLIVESGARFDGACSMRALDTAESFQPAAEVNAEAEGN